MSCSLRLPRQAAMPLCPWICTVAWAEAESADAVARASARAAAEKIVRKMDMVRNTCGGGARTERGDRPPPSSFPTGNRGAGPRHTGQVIALHQDASAAAIPV